MSVFNAISNYLQGCRTILSNDLCEPKGRYLLLYSKLFSKEIAVRSGLISTPKAERVHGFQVRFPTYGNVLSLWQEVFTKTPYKFRSDTQRPIIFDVGANIGMATLFFKLLYPEARITAFEPDPRIFKILEENVRVNALKDVTLVNKAAAAKTGEVTWHFDSDKPNSLGMSIVERPMHKDSLTVQATKLSDFINEPVTLLKIDVEGAEAEVLTELASSGAMRHVSQIAIEHHDWCPMNKEEISALLSKNGFSVTLDESDAVMIYGTRAARGGIADG